MVEVITKKAGMSVLDTDLPYANVMATEDKGAVFDPPLTDELVTSEFSNTIYPTEADNIEWNSVKFNINTQDTGSNNTLEIYASIYGITDDYEELIGEQYLNTVSTTLTSNQMAFLLSNASGETGLNRNATPVSAGKIGVRLDKTALNYSNIVLKKQWLTGWTYRTRINITNNANIRGTNITLEEINISYVSGKTNSDLGDIRFTQADGITPLTHWRESYTANSTAKFSVLLPEVPVGSFYIWYYYGNASATTASDFTGTFPLYSCNFENGNPLTYQEFLSTAFSTSEDTTYVYEGTKSQKMSFPTATAVAVNGRSELVANLDHLLPYSRVWVAVNVRDSRNSPTGYWYKRLLSAIDGTWPVVASIDCGSASNPGVWEKLGGFVDIGTENFGLVLQMIALQAISSNACDTWWDNLRVKEVMQNSSGATAEPTFTFGTVAEVYSELTPDAYLDTDLTILFTPGASPYWEQGGYWYAELTDLDGNIETTGSTPYDLTNMGQITNTTSSIKGIRVEIKAVCNKYIKWEVPQIQYNYSIVQEGAEWEL